MKIILLFIAFTLPIWASADMIIDQIVWQGPGNSNYPSRGGVIAPFSGVTDYLDGSAICNPKYPFPPPPFNRIVTVGLEVSNDTPACGSIGYWMAGSAYSDRGDGNYDHLKIEGAAWYPNVPGYPPNLPNTAGWAAACSASGTDANGNPNGIWGSPYLLYHTQGVCWPV